MTDDLGARLLAPLDRGLFSVERLTAQIGAVTIFGIMVAGSAEIIMRGLFNRPIPAYLESVELVIVAFAVLPISYCYRRDGHLRMDLLLRGLRGRSFWLAQGIATLVALAFLLAVFPGAWRYFLNSLEIGDSTMSAGWPIWPSKLAAAVGLGILVIRLLIELVAIARMIRSPGADPVAIPHKLDPLREAVD